MKFVEQKSWDDTIPYLVKCIEKLIDENEQLRVSNSTILLRIDAVNNLQEKFIARHPDWEKKMLDEDVVYNEPIKKKVVKKKKVILPPSGKKVVEEEDSD